MVSRPARDQAGSDLAASVGEADVVGCAILARKPVLLGSCIRPGTQLDPIGA
jgi:ornithine cyclodeaminase